jgi:LytS/YehU family sensor histidine kinase
MNPHFLFNVLNSIRALISENKAAAKSMVTELSEYLRYSLVSKNHENVPFKDEIESIRHYFNIQNMRYENKLDVSFEIDPAAEDPMVSFPPSPPKTPWNTACARVLCRQDQDTRTPPE